MRDGDCVGDCDCELEVVPELLCDAVTDVDGVAVCDGDSPGLDDWLWLPESDGEAVPVRLPL